MQAQSALSDSDIGPSTLDAQTAGPLPHPLVDYLHAPSATLNKLGQCLSALWQLRRATHLGRFPRVTGRLHILNEGKLVIGDQVRFYSHFARTVLVTLPNGTLEIGDRTGINYGVDIAATKLVRIGAGCMIGTHVTIMDSSFHEIDDRQRMPESRPVQIGNGVWIGNRSVILPGVTIGDGAVIGAGSVVISDIPSRSLAMGNPARVYKQL